ncbi:hypothetical protein OF377_00235 [Ureaplasma sp. ES3154-GEN]|uniref:MIP family Ig-specific serine endopeptidase n=1 Tax=Ureaplasma sp. ES3154-GEN TaxID=2984844 RepID=UPI0021E7DB3C|nr:hypothetical protein [Ureaplasma sp. ES3154-GEN]MCV3743316.1 hypothetical protein [Ureaplasma sp. ES3154-GEN]
MKQAKKKSKLWWSLIAVPSFAIIAGIAASCSPETKKSTSPVIQPVLPSIDPKQQKSDKQKTQTNTNQKNEDKTDNTTSQNPTAPNTKPSKVTNPAVDKLVVTDTKVYNDRINNYKYTKPTPPDPTNPAGGFATDGDWEIQGKPRYWNVAKNDQYKLLNDMTMKIETTNPELGVFTGTSWVVDYIEKEDGTYPTTWFLATNLHVVEKFLFEDDEYETGVANIRQPEQHASFYVNTVPELDTEGNVIKEQEQIAVSKYPKLFFAATNYFTEGKTAAFFQHNPNDTLGTETNKNVQNYYKDFAILKVEFDDSEQAKQATNDFYTKYKDNVVPFAKKSLLTQDPNILRDTYSLYTLSYPGSPVNRIDPETNKAYKYNSKFVINKREGDEDWDRGAPLYGDAIRAWDLQWRARYLLKNKYDQHIPGIFFAQTITIDAVLTGINYLNTHYDRIGLLYGMKDSAIPQGASGSLVINKDKEIVGILFGGNPSAQVGFVDPIIGEEVKYSNNSTAPASWKFDLINGAEGQTKSYKQQLDKFFPNLKTWRYKTR